MTRLEFQRKLDECVNLAKRGDYQGAVNIAEELRLDGVRDTRVLQEIAGAYEKRKMYEDAEYLLLRAKDAAPKSRGILFSLCTVAIRQGNLGDAQKYYNQFCELAKGDSKRYVLEYQIARAGKASDDQLIAILEKFKNADPDDRWLLELARLYAMNGRNEEAIEICDQISLWFSNGQYVKLSKKLRALLTGEAEPEEEDPTELEPVPETAQETHEEVAEAPAEKGPVAETVVDRESWEADGEDEEDFVEEAPQEEAPQEEAPEEEIPVVPARPKTLSQLDLVKASIEEVPELGGRRPFREELFRDKEETAPAEEPALSIPEVLKESAETAEAVEVAENAAATVEETIEKASGEIPVAEPEWTPEWLTDEVSGEAPKREVVQPAVEEPVVEEPVEAAPAEEIPVEESAEEAVAPEEVAPEKEGEIPFIPFVAPAEELPKVEFHRTVMPEDPAPLEELPEVEPLIEEAPEAEAPFQEGPQDDAEALLAKFDAALDEKKIEEPAKSFDAEEAEEVEFDLGELNRYTKKQFSEAPAPVLYERPETAEGYEKPVAVHYEAPTVDVERLPSWQWAPVVEPAEEAVEVAKAVEEHVEESAENIPEAAEEILDPFAETMDETVEESAAAAEEVQEEVITPLVTPVTEILPTEVPERNFVEPEIESEQEPEQEPEREPELEPEFEPEITPEAEPELEPEFIPEKAHEFEPEIESEITSEIEPEFTPEEAPVSRPFPVVVEDASEPKEDEEDDRPLNPFAKDFILPPIEPFEGPYAEVVDRDGNPVGKEEDEHQIYIITEQRPRADQPDGPITRTEPAEEEAPELAGEPENAEAPVEPEEAPEEETIEPAPQEEIPAETPAAPVEKAPVEPVPVSPFDGLRQNPKHLETLCHIAVVAGDPARALETAKTKLRAIEAAKGAEGLKLTKIPASRLSGIRIAEALDQFRGRMTILEGANDLSDDQLKDFAAHLSDADTDLQICFTGTREELEEVLRRAPGLKNVLSAVFDEDGSKEEELFKLVKETLRQADAYLDAEAEAAAKAYIHESLLSAEKPEESAKEFAEAALDVAEKGGLFGLFRNKRIDKEGNLTITEKDVKKVIK